MADYTVKRIDEIEGIYRGGFRLARAALGVQSFGMQVLELPPSFEDYPEHDHTEGGQEEVYLALRGSGELEIEGKRIAIDPETIVRVGPETRRKIYPGKEGLRLLALGGVPGAAYEASPGTELGTPDPLAS
jgi:mannose-6-phosphate isomerase-like protein (cupin superfamily)